MKQLPLLQAACCAPGAEPIESAAAEALAARFKALSVDEFELSQPTISHHLRLLREAGLVDSERRGTWAYYRLVPEAIDELRVALAG